MKSSWDSHQQVDSFSYCHGLGVAAGGLSNALVGDCFWGSKSFNALQLQNGVWYLLPPTLTSYSTTTAPFNDKIPLHKMSCGALKGVVHTITWVRRYSNHSGILSRRLWDTVLGAWSWVFNECGSEHPTPVLWQEAVDAIVCTSKYRELLSIVNQNPTTALVAVLVFFRSKFGRDVEQEGWSTYWPIRNWRKAISATRVTVTRMLQQFEWRMLLRHSRRLVLRRW